MTKKRYLIVSLVILALFLTACRTADIDEPRESIYRTGTDGLRLMFPTNTPKEIYENDYDVRMIVEVRNKGAFPQSDEIDELGPSIGKLWVGGYDKNILQITSRSQSDISPGVTLDSRELEGKSVYNREGGYSAAELVMRVLDLPDGMPYYRPRLIFTAVYRYKTIANPMVCIDPEPRSTKVREKTCEIGDYSAVGRGGGSGRGGSVGSGLGSQGAPIAVTRVEEDVTSDFILFKIYLRNVGTGMVIPENVIDRNPNEGYDFREMNTVRIEHIKAGSILMSECRPAMGDYVELIDELGYIFCKLEKSTNSITEAYATPLNIELSYGYTTSEEREIEIFEEIDFR